MAARVSDWLKQGKKDLGHAQRSLRMGDFEWAAFSAQQGAEKAVKALYQSIHADAWGHSVARLLAKLPFKFRPKQALLDRAKRLDHHYLAPRYPNSIPEGAPMDFYTKGQAQEAIADAKSIIQHCENCLR